MAPGPMLNTILRDAAKTPLLRMTAIASQALMVTVPLNHKSTTT
jgi:hypothetical protein